MVSLYGFYLKINLFVDATFANTILSMATSPDESKVSKALRLLAGFAFSSFINQQQLATVIVKSFQSQNATVRIINLSCIKQLL